MIYKFITARCTTDQCRMINEAWLTSPTVAINFTPQTYQDVEAGKIKVLRTLLYGDS